MVGKRRRDIRAPPNSGSALQGQRQDQSTHIGNETIPWGPRDLFVAPSWAPVIHDVAEEATLFSYSDRAVQEKLGIWRERRGNA